MLSLEESLLTEFRSNVETDHHEIDKAKLKGEGQKWKDVNKDNTNSIRDGNESNVQKQEELKERKRNKKNRKENK